MTQSNSYLAFRHYLVAGLATPLLVGLIISLVIKFFASDLFFTLPSYTPLLVTTISMIFGVWYSARNLKKSYTIDNPSRVSLYATIWLLIIGLLLIYLLDILFSFSLSLFLNGSFLLITVNTLMEIYGILRDNTLWFMSATIPGYLLIVWLLIHAIIFLLLSKKILKDSAAPIINR